MFYIIICIQITIFILTTKDLCNATLQKKKKKTSLVKIIVDNTSATVAILYTMYKRVKMDTCLYKSVFVNPIAYFVSRMNLMLEKYVND